MWRRARPGTTRLRLSTTCLHRRPFAGLAPETVEVPVGSNGSIKLDFYCPSAPPSMVPGPPTVILYVPGGSARLSSEDDESIIAALRAQLPFPVVQVNYRLDHDSRYPTPVHDILRAYDFVLTHLLPRRGITRAGRSEHVGRIAVCGQWVGGGSLATALALTECRAGQPGVAAAAICNPIVDWPGLQSLDHDSGLMAELLQLRSRLFRKPEHYFDPCASPILFFRSAGQAVPPPPTEAPSNDLDHLAFLDREEFFREQLALSALSNHNAEPSTPETEVRRKASKRYPSASLGLRLPMFHISTGAESPVKDQATELTQALRRSHLRQLAASDFGKKVLLDEEIHELEGEDREVELANRAAAETKAQLVVHTGLGLWGATPGGRARATEAARWLRSVLL
ncbi:alpha/beta hydrolase fold [Teratosphaeria destructans]|uniref:Alpha/beta hydrolase fold n=1 Tax=Teratosphaeria destructans TaxID=418781 RepID=A0A9W7W2W5_9PEZI|nr:alpha/beta hydrolase fold [Teratosphaeria destructans]